MLKGIARSSHHVETLLISFLRSPEDVVSFNGKIRIDNVVQILKEHKILPHKKYERRKEEGRVTNLDNQWNVASVYNIRNKH